MLPAWLAYGMMLLLEFHMDTNILCLVSPEAVDHRGNDNVSSGRSPSMMLGGSIQICR